MKRSIAAGAVIATCAVAALFRPRPLAPAQAARPALGQPAHGEAAGGPALEIALPEGLASGAQRAAAEAQTEPAPRGTPLSDGIEDGARFETIAPPGEQQAETP